MPATSSFTPVNALAAADRFTLVGNKTATPAEIAAFLEQTGFLKNNSDTQATLAKLSAATASLFTGNDVDAALAELHGVVSFYPTTSEFPQNGEADRLYVAMSDFSAQPAIYVWIGTVYAKVGGASASGATGSTVNRTAGNLNVTIGYIGSAAPALNGSAGSFTIVEPAQCKVTGYRAWGGSAAGSGGNISIAISSSGGALRYVTPALGDESNGDMFPVGGRGVKVRQLSGSGGLVTASYLGLTTQVSNFFIVATCL